MITGENLTYTTFVDNALKDIEKTIQEEEQKLTKKELREIINRQDEHIKALIKEKEKCFGKFMCAFIVASFTTLFLVTTIAINTRLETEVRTYQEAIHLMKEE
jgi:hypothetical protein